jgi:hypothetical protein
MAVHYFDKYANGTVKRYFFNGTIAVYYNGVFIRYDAKPESYYSEQDFIDYPTEYKEDGSKSIYYPNGTVRTFGPQDSETIYSDCFDNGTCFFYYKNGTITRWDNGMVVYSFTPKPANMPTTGGRDPSYTYVDKTGPKKQAYDKSQGGKKKYKEDLQNQDNRALKSEPTEPLCKGRNQMIIMGDWRIKKSVYDDTSARRRLQVVEGDAEGPNTLALQMESITFVPDQVPSSSALYNTVLGLFGLILSISVIMF